MQNVMDAVIDVAREGEHSPLSRRYAEMLDAMQKGYLTQKEMERVSFCDLEQQRYDGKLRTNRYIPSVTDSASDEQVKSWRIAEGQNWADGNWLERLSAFSKEHELTMNEKEAQWHIYVHEGIIGQEVAAYLKYYGSSKDMADVQS